MRRIRKRVCPQRGKKDTSEEPDEYTPLDAETGEAGDRPISGGGWGSGLLGRPQWGSVSPLFREQELE